MKQEVRKIKSILDLKPKFEDYTITNPESGEEWIIRLRPLTATEVTDLNASIKRPKPKEVGFRTNPSNGQVIKDEFGVPVPKFDDDNPEYIKALNKANQDFVYQWLVACSEMDIAGETMQEKVTTLRENTPNWVFLELQKKLQEVQGYRTSDVAYAKKKLSRIQADTSNTKSAKNAEGG